MGKKIMVILFLMSFLSLGVHAETEKKPSRKLPYKELIFPAGQLPSPHAPSIVEFPNGELFAVWYAATFSSSDSVIWGSRKPYGSDKWTAPSIIHYTRGYSNKNPVLYLGRDNKLFLFWADEKRLKMLFKWTIDTVRVKVSEDLGHTWGEPRSLGTPMGFLTRNHPIRLHDGRIILPLYVNWSTSSTAVASEDDGLTWGRPRYMLFFFGIQPTIIQRSDLSLYALMRTGMWPRRAWQAVSYNLGNRWKGQSISSIKNPGSSLEMVRLSSGNIVLVFVDSRTSLSNLSIAVSHDEGRTWPHVRLIEYGHLSTYPSIAQDRDGLIHVVYSYDDRRSIAHFVTDEQWIEGSKTQGPSKPE